MFKEVYFDAVIHGVGYGQLLQVCDMRQLFRCTFDCLAWHGPIFKIDGSIRERHFAGDKHGMHAAQTSTTISCNGRRNTSEEKVSARLKHAPAT